MVATLVPEDSKYIAATDLLLDCGKEAWLRLLVGDAIMLLWLMCFIKDHTCCFISRHTQFCCLVCGVLALGKLLPCPKEAVADPLPKHLLFSWWEFSCATVTKSLKATVADPTWILSTIAAIHSMCCYV